MARHLLDTSLTPCYLSSFSSLFISQSQQLLDTWWIDRESSCLLDSFSTPDGSIELLFLDLMSCCSIPQLSTCIFSIPTLTASSTPLDTSSVEIYWRFYISLLVLSEPHFTRYLSITLYFLSQTLSSHSNLDPQRFLQAFSRFSSLGKLLISYSLCISCFKT